MNPLLLLNGRKQNAQKSHNCIQREVSVARIWVRGRKKGGVEQRVGQRIKVDRENVCRASAHR